MTKRRQAQVYSKVTLATAENFDSLTDLYLLFSAFQLRKHNEFYFQETILTTIESSLSIIKCFSI